MGKECIVKDRLFLLKPSFMDQGKGPYFCPGCVVVEGMLSFYPGMRDKIEVNYIDFPRPRSGLVALIGAENQTCPKLILTGEYPIPEGIAVSEANQHRFIADPLEICRYLGKTFAVGIPHD
jgi:hypothetical protein